jgi:hypothetical protein
LLAAPAGEYRRAMRDDQKPIVQTAKSPSIHIHAIVAETVARIYVILRAVLRIGLTRTVHPTMQPSTPRIQVPGSESCKKSQREDHNRDREQLKHMRTPPCYGGILSLRRDQSLAILKIDRLALTGG